MATLWELKELDFTAKEFQFDIEKTAIVLREWRWDANGKCMKDGFNIKTLISPGQEI